MWAMVLDMGCGVLEYELLCLRGVVLHWGSMEQALIEGEQPRVESEHAAGEDCEPKPLIAGITGQAVGGIKTATHGRPTHQKKEEMTRVLESEIHICQQLEECGDETEEDQHDRRETAQRCGQA